MVSVADVIHQHADDIMEMWLAEARTSASARGLSNVALKHVMPMYLSALAAQVGTGQVDDANDWQHTPVQQHLAARLREGCDVAEILGELGLVERCIASMWLSRPPEEWPSAPDIERLHAQIQIAISDVAETFRRHMLEDEQSEKRYLRLLQTIASEALHGDEPLRNRLRALLEIVMDAMSARCAAFLAYDLANANLALISCAGADAIESYATSLDMKSFAAKVSGHDEPTQILDAGATRLEVPDALRACGIHSLLGIRLPINRDLLTVMYIGIAETREFTSREIARLASLGERLSLHFENARLFAALNSKVDSLAVEKSLRDHFVSALAHDLRGPLAAARLAAELLALNPASVDERRALALNIDRNIERVDRMIRDLLDANRIRACERLPLRLDSCDLVAIAEQVADEARAMHGDRFVVDARASSVRGIWSEDELHRALWNLITNAVKYGAPKLPITITVEQCGEIARVSVHNAGTPISADDQAHIFDAYARTRSADAGDCTGWGLGLTLVRGTAEAHGGHVSLTSDAESGTAFTIEIPLDARVDWRHGEGARH
jgi:signal transduction histidine kinase